MAECAKGAMGAMGGTATPTTAIQTIISDVLGVYGKEVFAVPPKNEGLERAPEYRLPGPRRTLTAFF